MWAALFRGSPARVSATLFLDQHGGDDQPHIGGGDAIRQIGHGRTQSETEVLFVKALAQLTGDGFANFLGSDTECGRVNP